MNIRVSILETGRIRIRPSYRSQSADTPVWLRRLRVLCDRHWTEPLPINVYLIEHPEGRILFDCGESPRAASPGYFPWWQPFFCLCTDIRITPTEGIGARLAARGIDPKTDLKAVVLSHLHHDHADGLPDLVGAPVFVSAAHWAAFGRPLQAALQGAVPAQWPVGFVPHILEPIGPPVGPWNKSYPITEDGRVVAVDTPGHVPGHISFVVRSDDATYLAAGDLTYD